ncbi:MAG TPA: DinB family protein [Tepidisphaeraceae bacterium]|nr:DinB family protein [Tepidisphaeraceae bacterium]
MAKKHDPLREHLLELLGPGGAHADFDRAVGGLAAKFYNAKLPNVPHSPWDLLEHLRLAQRDILEFTKDPRHESPPWPEGYWPKKPATAKEWKKSIAAFKADRAAMLAIVTNPKTDLLAPLPHGQGQTVAREAMLLADHCGYHLGQLILLRRALGAWKD